MKEPTNSNWPISLERFLNIRTAYGPTLSPDGRRMAFIATITGVPQVWALDAPALPAALSAVGA